MLGSKGIATVIFQKKKTHYILFSINFFFWKRKRKQKTKTNFTVGWLANHCMEPEMVAPTRRLEGGHTTLRAFGGGTCNPQWASGVVAATLAWLFWWVADHSLGTCFSSLCWWLRPSWYTHYLCCSIFVYV